MEAGAKPFEEKFHMQGQAVEKIGDQIRKDMEKLSCTMDVVLADMSEQERKQVYDLNTVSDISQVEDTEKEYLCAVLYAIANQNSDLTPQQQHYIRAVKSYLRVVDIQPDINLASIENIDNVKVQKAILQTVMEFLFLEYRNHNYMTDYQDIFQYFSVNKRGIEEIQRHIDIIYKTIGIEGLAEHYGKSQIVAKAEQPAPVTDNGIDLRSRAEAAYLRYDMAEALPFFKLLSEQNDSRSYYFLGMIYKSGYKGIVVPDQEQANAYWQTGMDNGDVLCALRIAEGSDDEQKGKIYSSVFDVALMLAQKGNIYAAFEIGRIYAFAYEPMHDHEKAIYWYTIASNAGLLGATNNLANLYCKDSETFKQGIELFQKSVNSGHELAMYNLASYYWYGDGVEEDEEKALDLWQKSADLGWRQSLKQLGEIAEFFDKDYRKAIEYYEKAMERGEYSASYDMARAFCKLPFGIDTIDWNGTHLQCNTIQMSEACLIMASMCSGEDVDVELAGHIVHNRIDEIALDILRSQNMIEPLIECYNFNSEHTLLDELRKWGHDYLQQMAEAGNPKAQYYLGMMYVELYKKNWKVNDKKLAESWLTKVFKLWNKDANQDFTKLCLDIHDILKKLDKTFVFNWPSTRFFVTIG